MNSKEITVLDSLEKAWNNFLELEILHTHDLEEFMRGIHTAQLVVMARPVMRQEINSTKGENNDRSSSVTPKR